MRRDESLAMAAMAHEATALKDQVDAWKAWAARVLGECGVTNAHRIGAQPSRDLIAKLAKGGAAAEVKP